MEKIKTIKRHRCHPEEKYWSFPSSNGTLEKILKVFESEKIYIDPSLKPQLNRYIIARNKVPKQSHTENCHSELVSASSASRFTIYNFEDLKRELVSRKYSYKTVKTYLYYNKNFLNFVSKSPSDITNDDIKNSLVYLSEEKQSATSTLNQAINALKLHYGMMLKKKFVYEVKRPRKDKKLPIVLSKEEDSGKIKSSLDRLQDRWYICSTAYIPPNWKYICNIADIRS